MNVIEAYEDRARSGGSVMGRAGLLRLLDQAREQSFDVVVVEALDRLSRDMEDLAGIHKRLSFLGIALSKGINAGDSEAAEAIRDLVETVTVFRDSSRPGAVTVEIAGRLNALLGEQAYPNKVRGVW